MNLDIYYEEEIGLLWIKAYREIYEYLGRLSYA